MRRVWLSESTATQATASCARAMFCGVYISVNSSSCHHKRTFQSKTSHARKTSKRWTLSLSTYTSSSLPSNTVQALIRTRIVLDTLYCAMMGTLCVVCSNKNIHERLLRYDVLVT